MDKVLQDDRFSHVSKDPRFRQMPRKEKKIKIDKRFKGMFSDKKFKLKYTVDKRGRPVQATTNENLRKFYELSDEDESESEGDSDSKSDNEMQDVPNKNKKNKNKKDSRGNTFEDAAESDDDDSAIDISDKNTNSRKTKKNKIKEIKSKNDMGKRDKVEKRLSKEKGREHENIISESTTSKYKKEKLGLKEGNISGKKEKLDSSCDDQSDLEDEELTMNVNKKKGVQELDRELDFARGEGNIESSSEEDEDDDQEIDENDDEEYDHQWGELDKDVPEAMELGRRLAVCNLDWDRIKAQDIFVSLNSFKPPNGVLHSVKIYPSEYGLQRMKEESVKGPTELIDNSKKQQLDDNKDLDTEDIEGNKYHRERLRQYQLNRLKYYYAVVELDSIDTANHIYEECDGLEYETSASRLDLRFIPDDMEFDQEPKSICTEMPHSSTYKPSLFITSALCQSKVDLTWDETDKDRINVTMKKVTKKEDIKEDDFRAYLASSSDEEGPGYYGALNLDEEESEEESEDEETQIDRYRKLAQSVKEEDKKHKNKDLEMEISWEPGLKETTEKIIKKKEEIKNATPWEEYLAKKKEKKKSLREEKKKQKSDKNVISETKNKDEPDESNEGENVAFSDDDLPAGVDLNDPFFAEELKDDTKVQKKGKKKSKKLKKEETTEESDKKKQKEAELSLLMMDESESSSRHFNLKTLIEDGKKKKKKKMKHKPAEKLKKTDEDEFTLDVKDDRFEAIYTSHLYNIDPSAPEFKKTAAMESVIKEKLKRREKDVQKKTGVKRPNIGDISDISDTKQKKLKETSDSNFTKVKDQSLDSLVKSVKLKTQKFQKKSKS